MKLDLTPQYLSPDPTVVALGCFDGVHLGHAAVLRAARARADELGCTCTVWTFHEPPRNFFAPGSVTLLTDAKTKSALIGTLGVDTLISLPFSREVGSLPADVFFETLLCERLHACHVICGYNYTFGAGGKGDVTLLRELCDARGIGLTVVPPVTVGALPVSSSEIRCAITEGRPEDAAAMLGRPYSLRAPVVDGQHLARKLGFPTTNQIFPDGMTIPRAGVYATRITIGEQDSPLYGISNVGIRPTVKSNILCCETHIFDYVGDLYQKEVQIEFLSFLRPERKFDSIGALAEQVGRDIRQAKSILQKGDFS